MYKVELEYDNVYILLFVLSKRMNGFVKLEKRLIIV